MRVSSIKLTAIVVWAVFSATAAIAGPRLLFFETVGSFERVSYGGDQYERMTSELDENFGTVTTTIDLSDLDEMLTYDAIWIAPQYSDQDILSIEEIDNLTQFISSGRRVVMTGENVNWAAWNQSILSIVGGSYDDGFFYGQTSPVVSHELTEGVSAVFVGGGGTESSGNGLSLFEENFATLWGDNVLTILEGAIFSDSEDWPGIGWNDYDNGVFGQNVVNWLAIPEPATFLLLASGAVLLNRKR